MLYIETLGIPSINCNTIDTKEFEGTENCKTNTVNSQEPTSKQYHVNMRQGTRTTEKCYTNIDIIVKFGNKGKPAVTDNDNLRYFLPDLNSNINTRVNTEVTQQQQREFKDVFHRIGCLMVHFHYRPNQIASHTRHPKTCRIHTAKAIQRRIRVTTAVRHHHTTRH